MINPLFTFIRDNNTYVYFRNGQVKPVETGLINEFNLSTGGTKLVCRVSAIDNNLNIRFVGNEAVTFLHFNLKNFSTLFSYPHALFPIETVHRTNNIITLSSSFSVHMTCEIKEYFNECN